MAQLKTDKITLAKDFQIDLSGGWILGVDVKCTPTNYTLTHGKKTINFNSDVMKNLCFREYGIRLMRGRKQMVVPPHVLQNLEEYTVFLQWYDPFLSTNHHQSEDHVTPQT